MEGGCEQEGEKDGEKKSRKGEEDNMGRGERWFRVDVGEKEMEGDI